MRKIVLLLAIAFIIGINSDVFAQQSDNQKSDDFSVDDGGRGTYKPPPQQPPKKCKQVCRTEYYDCAADCYRGGILVMGGCLGKCSFQNCTTECE